MTVKQLSTARSLGTASAVGFIQEAGRYRSDIKLVHGNARVSAKSLLSVSSLSIVKGDRVTLVANGPDEKEAIEALTEILSSER